MRGALSVEEVAVFGAEVGFGGFGDEGDAETGAVRDIDLAVHDRPAAHVDPGGQVIEHEPPVAAADDEGGLAVLLDQVQLARAIALSAGIAAEEIAGAGDESAVLVIRLARWRCPVVVTADSCPSRADPGPASETFLLCLRALIAPVSNSGRQVACGEAGSAFDGHARGAGVCSHRRSGSACCLRLTLTLPLPGCYTGC